MPGDTHTCGDCGDEGHGDRNNRREPGGEDNERNINNIRCDNPCGRGPGNSAKCESLPSQIQNFTQQFFGDVVKTEVNGVVSWSLPCMLDVGLPANPRGIGEGLACYFLRLFEAGIHGLKGDPGTSGTAGATGANAYTVVLASFTQPSLAFPNVQVVTAFNPGLSLTGMHIFIDTSGWYTINGTDGNGVLFLSLNQPVPGAPAVITAGKLVLPAGTPGISVTGPQGLQGSPGAAGPPGATTTSTNGVYATPAGSNFALPVISAQVDFTASFAQFLAPVAGVYYVTVTATVKGITGIAATDQVTLKLRNTSLFSDVPGSLQTISGLMHTDEPLGVRQVVLCSIAQTTAPGQMISLFGACSNSGKAQVLFNACTIAWVQIA